MPKPFTTWTVLPHDPLTRLDEDLFSVTGTLRMPLMGEVERRMTVVRLAGGRLAIYSAIALDDAEMSELESLGVPTFLIVPNDLHRMDAGAWKDRFPTITVVAPPGARPKVEEIIPVDATSVDFDDPSVQFVTVPGTGEREAALVVQALTGTTLVLNDLIFNLPNGHGLGGLLLRAIGMTGDTPHIPPVIRMRQVKDRAALRAQFERWSRLPDLKRIIIAHGAIIAAEPARVLAHVAEGLAA